MFRLVPLLLVLGQAGAPVQFNGVSYQRPAGWQERSEGELRALIPPGLRSGRVLMVLIAAARPATGDPGAELARFADAAEASATHHQRGPVQSQRAGRFTLLVLTSKVDAPGVGVHQRIYQLVTDGSRSAFVTALSKGDETLEAHQSAMLQLMASVRPGGAGPSSEPPAAAAAGAGHEPAPARPAPGPVATHVEAAPAGTGIPNGPSQAPVLDPRFLPSGRGRPIPPPAMVGGRPVGIDGTLVHFFRPGGPHLVDLEGMRALGDGDFIGRYSVAAGTMTTEIGKGGEYRRSKPLTVRQDPAGVSFLFDGDEYHPAIPLTRQSLVGTWKMGARGTFTFRADGTVVTPANMIGASWGRADSKEVLTGTWALDGYLLALRFPTERRRVGLTRSRCPAAPPARGGAGRSPRRW